MLVFTLRLCFFYFFFYLQSHHGALVAGGQERDECNPTRCSSHGPLVHSPFWLKNHQPDHCGASPAFTLSCSATNHTLLSNNPSSGSGTGEVIVAEINYISQSIRIEDHNPFTPNLVCLQSLSLPASSPFRLRTESTYNHIASPSKFSIFECHNSINISKYTSCLSSQNHSVVVLDASSSTTKYTHVQSCRKKFQDLEWQIADALTYCDMIWWEWSVPRKDKFSYDRIIGMSLAAAVVFMGLCYCGYRKIKLKKDGHKMVERFLNDYKALKPTRYTYAEIKKITNNFIEKLGQGGYGTVYKGKLSNDVHIAVKILKHSNGNGENEFLNEVGTIGTIHHVNVVRLVGYCADGFRRALVYEFLPNDSLEKHISSPDQRKQSLSWDKLQEIALGIAKGIEYLHQGCDQQILHFDIKPQNILLDENFNPKVADFGLAKLCSKDQSAVSMTIARGTIGYIAPEVISRNFGKVSHKSDVYSFGMLLLEMAGGRKNPEIREENESEIYFPEWIYNHLNREIEEVAIEIEDDQEGEKIVKKLMTVGLWCIQWTPGDRPSMKTVVQMLEGDGDTLPMPPNPFVTRNSATGGTLNSLEVISECESETLD